MSNKAVLISIQPRWCKKIASGEKTIEVRKTRPKLPTPFKCYIYCTKSELLTRSHYDGRIYVSTSKKYKKALEESGNKTLSGMVIGEFVCDTFVIDITYGHDALFNAAACMSDADVAAYCLNSQMFGWHISNLKIYDKPKELSEFCKAGFETIEALDEGLCKYCLPTNYGELRCYSTPNGYVSCEGGYCCEAYRSYLDENFALIRPPQSWCYVGGIITQNTLQSENPMLK